MSETRTYGRRRRQLPAEAATAEPASPSTREAITGRVVATGSDGSTQMAGWDAVDKTAAASGADFYLKISEYPIIIKIVGDGPFDVYNSHWIEEIEEGSKSVRCVGPAQACALCNIGDKAKRFSACFDVISLEDSATPAMKVWEVGIKLARQLKDIAMDSKRGPLNRPDTYFAIKKEQKKKNTEYTLERVKERDLYEEYDIEPLTPDVLAGFRAEAHQFGDQVKEVLGAEEMSEVVDLLTYG
ncbi:hypothetical protein ACFQ61_08415 [Streptomyces sp. NPDC056500]|uniref:hypothetical protein n=1 Tax=Streptomyces sp. NPDC056500 TaxID=3345840 RepID=UPI0036B0B676